MLRGAANVGRLLLEVAARSAFEPAAPLSRAAAAVGGGGGIGSAAAAGWRRRGLVAAAAAAAAAGALPPAAAPPRPPQVRVLKCKRGDATPVSQAVALLVSSDLLPRGALHANLAALADDLRQAVEAGGVARATRRDREQYAQRERAPRSSSSSSSPSSSSSAAAAAAGVAGGGDAAGGGGVKQPQPQPQPQPQQHRRPALGLASSALEAGETAERESPPEQTLRSEPFTTTEVAAFLEVCRRSDGFLVEGDEGGREREGAADADADADAQNNPPLPAAEQQRRQFVESALALFEALAAALQGRVARMPPDELPPLLWALARVYVSRGGGGVCAAEPRLRDLLDEATTALTAAPAKPPADDGAAAAAGPGRRSSSNYHAPFIGEGGGGGGDKSSSNEARGKEAAAAAAAQAPRDDGGGGGGNSGDDDDDDDDDAAGEGLSAVANEELPIVARALADLEHRDPLLLTELAEAVLERRGEFSPSELAEIAEAMAVARRCFFDARVLRALGEEAAARVAEAAAAGGGGGAASAALLGAPAAAAARAAAGMRRVAAALRACGFEMHRGG